MRVKSLPQSISDLKNANEAEKLPDLATIVAQCFPGRGELTLTAKEWRQVAHAYREERIRVVKKRLAEKRRLTFTEELADACTKEEIGHRGFNCRPEFDDLVRHCDTLPMSLRGQAREQLLKEATTAKRQLRLLWECGVLDERDRRILMEKVATAKLKPKAWMDFLLKHDLSGEGEDQLLTRTFHMWRMSKYSKAEYKKLLATVRGHIEARLGREGGNVDELQMMEAFILLEQTGTLTTNRNEHVISDQLATWQYDYYSLWNTQKALFDLNESDEVWADSATDEKSFEHVMNGFDKNEVRQVVLYDYFCHAGLIPLD